MFYFRHVARQTYPQKHILICEDDLTNQKRILEHLLSIFEPQGIVQFSVVCGGIQAASIISSCNVDLIILDHDMPQGNGTDLLHWLKGRNSTIPVVTFSGIPSNNINMMNLGATFLFQKEEVMTGMADNMIKMSVDSNSAVVERYINKICINQPTASRYWVRKGLMVGGSICDANDWEHLKTAYGIEAVINVETEHSDIGRGFHVENLLESTTQDDGTPFSAENILNVISFAESNKEKITYLHCQMGGSRSPAFAYAILRHVDKLSPEDALSKINEVLPGAKHGKPFGSHQYHISYLNSIENVLKNISVLSVINC
jgi:CheY-like chemotaxis protein